MRTLLILASALGVAYAGVGTLSPSEEAEALQLFARLCSGYGAEGQDIGGTLVYCKRGKDDRTERLNHNVNVQDNTRQPGQVVFVQPPPVRYQHRVLVQGQGAQGQQTKVYVLPQQASHDLSADYRGGQVNAVKPVVYFLKGGESGGSSGYGAPTRQIETSYGSPSSQPGANYGAPGKSSGYSG
ncbi:unnamed protein product [Orchesella dallaii]|uniref:DUF243 domain-containing protein n=1 Tax=Orchesella dallaii TaxID=48710 RepID=A0ABP1QEW2_9HEXA